MDDSDLETHGVSDWSYHDAKKPTVVVWADSTDEVREIVKIATKWRVPITPFSGGTSLEGHFSSVSVFFLVLFLALSESTEFNMRKTNTETPPPCS